MIKSLLKILGFTTTFIYKGLSYVVDKEKLDNFRPIPLCETYGKYGLNAPPFVGHVTAPSVSTGSASSISYTTFTQAGNITSTGGENASSRGVCYMVGTSGDPTTANSTNAESGSFGTGTYSRNLTGLTPNTSYRVRAYAINSAGTGYGTTITVTTLDNVVTLSVNDSVTVSENINLFFTARNLSVSELVRVVDLPGSGDTYYFDVSDAGPTDTNAVWTNDANAFDGSLDTFATVNSSGSTSSNFLLGEGTNAPNLSDPISNVRVAIYASDVESQGWSGLNNLSTPSGGWTWAKIQALEVKIYKTSTADTNKANIAIYTDGLSQILGATTNNSTNGVAGDDLNVHLVEVLVTRVGLLINPILLSVSDSISVVDYEMGSLTYYFNGSDAAATDPNAVWTDETNADDGNIATVATTATAGSASSNYLKVEGTNTSDLGFPIIGVRARLYGLDGNSFGPILLAAEIYTDGGTASGENIGTVYSNGTLVSGYGSYVSLSTPSGGWTWAKIQALEFYAYLQNGALQANAELARVEIEITWESAISADIEVFSSILDLNVFDSVTVTEFIGYPFGEIVYVDEYILLSIEGEGENSLSVSVFDGITVVDEDEVFIPTLVPSVFDAVTVVDEDSILIPILFISVNDEVTVVDDDNIVIPILILDVFDAITVVDEDSILIPILLISVFDEITVTENISLSVPLPVFVYDEITVSENIQLNIPVNLSVFDEVTVTENISLSIPLPVSVYDEVTITENTSFVITTGNSIFEEITVSENITLSIPLPVFVYDEVTVTENISLSVPLPVFVFDAITITENISLSVPLPINVYESIGIDDVAGSPDDYVLVSEFITITVNEPEDGNLYVSVFDEITVTENISLSIPLPVFVYDEIAVSEDVTLNIPVYLSVFDEVTVTENISLSIPLPVFVYDEITITEAVTVVIPILLISVSDQITVTENISLSIPLPVFVYDEVTITESVSLTIPVLISVSDTVTVTEDVVVHLGTGNAIYEQITVSEDVTIRINTFVSVSDEVVVSDVPSLYIPILYLSVNDQVTVTENFQTNVVSYISVNDSITISEEVNLTIPVLFISVFDEVTVTENISLSIPLPVFVYDEVTVAEDITLNISLSISVFDEVTVTENISLSIPLPVFVYDEITVVDAPDLYIPVLFLSVSDDVSVEEFFLNGGSNAFSINDAVTVSENVTIVITYLVPSVYDEVTVTENISLSIPLPVSTFDSVTVSENVEFYILVSVDVFDEITVTDVFSSDVVSYISVSDAVEVSENVILSVPLPVFVEDTITVSEDVTLVVNTNLFVFDPVTVTENTSIAPSTEGNVVYDTITVSEDITLYIPELFLSVYEEVSITEVFSAGAALVLLVEDTITVSEEVTLNVTVEISVYDEASIFDYPQFEGDSVYDVITVSEDIAFYIETNLSVYEEISVTDIFTSEGLSTISVYDLITVSENYHAIRKKYGKDIHPNRPRGTIVEYSGLGSVEWPNEMTGIGSGY